jgi:RNA polymerase sigma-70 factor (ECF subfamily)
MDGPDFARALAAAREGDEAAFASLWRSYNPPLLRYLGALAGAHDTDDVASTTWVEVVRNLDRFAGDESSFRAWLFTIARHRLIDLRRSEKRRPTVPLGDDEADAASGGPDPAVLADASWSSEAAVALVRTLPPDQAEVILLRVVAGLDVATVATMTGKRPGTVRVLAHRALRRLAERVEGRELVRNLGDRVTD